MKFILSILAMLRPTSHCHHASQQSLLPSQMHKFILNVQSMKFRQIKGDAIVSITTAEIAQPARTMRTPFPKVCLARWGW